MLWPATRMPDRQLPLWEHRGVAKFVYIDETGSVGTNNAKQPHLTLVAAIVDEPPRQVRRGTQDVDGHRNGSPWRFRGSPEHGAWTDGQAPQDHARVALVETRDGAQHARDG